MTWPLIDAHELLADDQDTLVLDATVVLPRPRADGDHRASSGADGWRAEHVPGSAHLDLLAEFTDPAAGYHFAQPTPEHAHRVLTRLGARDSRRVVLYDRSDGFWAARGWWSLRALGVPSRVLDGGFAAWRAAGGPVAGPRDTRSAAARGDGGDLTLRPRADAWADLDDVRAIMDGTAPGRLVCALGAEQFAGTAPTRYARRGHIPGSTNLPARGVSDERGFLLPAGMLHQRLAPARGPGRLVVYCGGGISASRLALALVTAGAEHVALYDGSLEEWAARPDLPLLTAVPETADAAG